MKHPHTETIIKPRTRLNHILNLKMIAYVLGILMWVEGGLFLICMGISLYFGEPCYKYFLYTTAVNFVIGLILMACGRGGEKWLTRRDGYCIVTFTWILFTLSGMMPFYLSGAIPSITNAFFETMSGFTTTGATILDDIEAIPHGLLFWRSLTQWIGGLGIMFFTIAILPIFGGSGNLQLFSSEATGVTHDKIHPKISITTQWIWSVYIILTGLVIGLLIVGGMDWFDAICHSFSTMGTGGYSTKQASVAHWNSPFIEYVIATFMIIASINFTLVAFSLQGKFRRLFQDNEVRWFLGSITVLTLTIAVILFAQRGYGIEEAFRKAYFQVATIHSSSGFSTDDYNLWPQSTWMLLIFAMISGGCTGSTAGGVKCMRIMVLYHNIRNEFKRLLHPNAILPVKVNNHIIPQNTINAVTTFTIFYILCAFIGCTILLSLGIGFLESFSTVISALSNIGPGFGSLGPVYSMNSLPELGKWTISFMMLIGRLELFSVLILFHPVFWKDW